MKRAFIVTTAVLHSWPLVGLRAAQRSASIADASAGRPNIIFMMADDLGYRDLSCFGGKAVKTPHLDRMAAEGMKLNRYYTASAVCSPTRASVMTGCYPLRFGISRAFNDRDQWLPQSATTLPTLLRQAGYATAHVGKWHLGGLHVGDDGRRSTNQPGPREHGFDSYLCQIEQQPLRGEMGKARTLHRQGGTVLIQDDQRLSSESPHHRKHFTDVVGDHAIESIKKYAAAKTPFFLNVWWLPPHAPFEPSPEPYWSATAADGITQDQRYFRSMMAHLDAKIGEILKTVDELGLAKNTLVIFTSDNGAAYEGDVGTLKGGKGDLHEGGIRVPFIARLPGKISAGVESDSFAHSTDLLPTLCAAAGADVPGKTSIDGKNIWPHLSGAAPITAEQRGTVFWQMDHYGIQRRTPKPEPFATEVVRRGPWKLLAIDGKPVELIQIDRDPDELRNVMSEEPKLVASLESELQTWLAKYPRIRPAVRRAKKE